MATLPLAIFFQLGTLFPEVQQRGYAKTQSYIDGKFIEEHKIDRELNLKGTVCPNNFVKAKLALEEMKIGQALKIIVDYEPAVVEVPKAMEFDGHKILEIKRLNLTDWEIIIQKHNGSYAI